MLQTNLELVNAFALRKQHLTHASKIYDIPMVVNDIVGLHATSPTVPYLSLFARHPDFKRGLLEDELYEKKSLAKIRCIRKTIYIHTQEMIPVAYAATATSVIEASRRYMEARGVSSNEYDVISKKILDLLSQEEMTASAIKEALDSPHDISSILYFMCDQGILVRARPVKSWRDKNHRYARFCDTFPSLDLNQYDEKDAIAHLIERYIASFGPVTENDILWWTGLGKNQIRLALEDLRAKVHPLSIKGLNEVHYALHEDFDTLSRFAAPTGSTINLLPHLDPYLMGYKDRARYLSPHDTSNVFDRSGNATSTILLNGKVIGLWDFVKGKAPIIKLLFLHQPPPATKKEILREAQRLGTFIAEEEVKVTERETMIPLTERTAGGFMTPLKD